MPRQRSGFGVALLFGSLLTLLGACQSVEAPSSPSAQSDPLLQEGSLDDISFSADVDIDVNIAGFAGKGIVGPMPAQRLSYRIERSKDKDGKWRTVYSNLVFPLDRQGPTIEPRLKIARVERDDVGSVEVFNGVGERMSTARPDIAKAMAALGGLNSPHIQARLQTLASGRQETPISIPSKGKVASTIAAFVVDVEREKAAVARFRASGRPVRMEGTYTSHTLGSKTGSLEVVTDSDQRIVQTVRRPLDGPVTRVRYEHAPGGSGRLVRTVTRLEREPFRNSPRITIETRLSNVHIENGGADESH